MSTTPAGHLDLDALADHLAGELDATSHLIACPGCRARLAELEAAERMVIVALASLSAPPMPAALVDRLAAVLAAEPDRRSPAARPEGPGTADLPAAPDVPAAADVRAVASATVTPLAGRRRRWLPAVAAGAVLFAGGLLGVTLLTGGGGTADQATTTAGASRPESDQLLADRGVVTVNSGLDYADTAAVTAALPAVLSGTVDFASRPGPAGSPAGAPGVGSTAELDAQDPLAPLRDPAGLSGCLAALLPPDEPDVQPVALDYASYAGSPALAVWLPDPDPARIAVFVVGPGCSRTTDATLFFTRLNRP